tara:strand:+ start:10210 stop:10632 length:423 start_codon:yes stop_codon:yes gene_type:complete
MGVVFNTSESSSLNSDYPKSMSMPNQYGFGGIENYMVISAATTNEAFLKKGKGSFYGISLTNTGASDAYIRIFDKASAPVSASDTPIAIFAMQADSVNNFFLPIPVGLKNGLAINITGLATTGDATAVATNQVVGSVFWK